MIKALQYKRMMGFNGFDPKPQYMTKKVAEKGSEYRTRSNGPITAAHCTEDGVWAYERRIG